MRSSVRVRVQGEITSKGGKDQGATTDHPRGLRRKVRTSCEKTPYLACGDDDLKMTQIKGVKDRYGEPERGEWMGADKNSSRRRWRLQQDEHNFQHTSPTHYPSWPRPRSHCSATGPRNQQPTSQTRERSRTRTSSLTDLHRSGRWAPPVRPVPAGETWRLPQNSHYTGQAGVAHQLDRFKIESPKTPNRPTELQTDPNSKQQQ
jgi:hypothetical protein